MAIDIEAPVLKGIIASYWLVPLKGLFSLATWFMRKLRLMQSILANAITIIAGCASLGYLLDLWLLDDSTRAKLRAFISRRRGQAQPMGQTLLEFIRLINTSVFERVFPGRFFSWQYFFTCVAVSVVALILILAAQLYFFGPADVAHLGLTSEQIGILLACLMTNLVIDWVSIGQTHAFFRISANQDAAWKSILLIVSDIILTLNVFTILYSQVVSYTLLTFTLVPTDIMAEARVFVTKLESEELGDFLEEHPAFKEAKLNSPATLTFFTTLTAGENKVRGPIIQILSDPEQITLADVIKSSKEFSNASIYAAESEIEYEVHEKNESVETKRKTVVRGSPEWLELYPTKIVETDRVRVSIPSYGTALTNNRKFAYTVSFRAVDEVQLSFPPIILTGPLGIHLENLMSQYHHAMAGKERTTYSCYSSGTWKSYDSVTPLNSGCERKIMFLDPGTNIELLGSMRALAASAEGKLVPLNTLFLTSFSITILLYAFAILLAVSRGIWILCSNRIAGFEPYFLRAPFGWAGLVIGVFLFIATL